MYELVCGVLDSAVDMLNWIFSHKTDVCHIFERTAERKQ